MNAIRNQLRSMLSCEPRNGGFRATLTLGASFSVLPDHFAGSPILPGMCMVQAVLLAGAMQQGLVDLQLVVLKNAKLMSPVQPGDVVVIDADITGRENGEIGIKAKLSCDGKRTAEIALIARPVVVESTAAV